ncbi:hypothetical protein VTP01DRAFT_10821 [Rhizomucor pusillus]|uniref:uncharacterized protein n=1 Tax=Rhizomucor pusillus TaxID=4840 RepID=UPI003742767B
MSSIGFIARFSSFDLLNKPDSADNRYSIFQPLLETLVHDNHRLYEMENQDKTNVLYRTLAALYELGATQEQSIKAYYNILPDLVPLRSTISMEITKDNWREHLGNSSFYAAYLAFFAHQIHEKGMDEAVHEYLLGGRLYASIGSHLQPLVHLTFGLEHDLALVVAQGLAYLASTYSDISDMLSIDSSFPQCSETKEEKVIFELIASDPRFSGRMGDRLTSSQASKRLLKTHKQLLTAYMNSSDISLGRLARIAAGLLVATSGDKSLAAVQLLESALAMQTICSRYGEQPELLLPLSKSRREYVIYRTQRLGTLHRRNFGTG